MTSFVFDTGALSLFYAYDERLRRLVEGIESRRDRGLICSVTLSEFYYKICQTLGKEVATLWSKQLDERMQVVGAEIDLALSAGADKCMHGKLSLADSYALALTNQVRGTLLTTDSELAKCKESNVKFFELRDRPRQ